MIPSNNSYYSSTSSPHRLSHHHPRVHNDRLGAGGETPLSETRRRGIRRAVVRSPGVAVARRARSRPPSQGPSPCPGRRCFRPPLPPACAEPRPPRLVPSCLDTCPPHPCQGFREPSRPLPCLPPTATTMPTTSAASKPQWTHFLRMTGRGPPSPRCRRPHLPERVGVGREGRRTPCRSRDHAAARSGASAPSSLVAVVVGGGRSPATVVSGCGGSGGIGSGGGDNGIGFGVSIVCMCGVCVRTCRLQHVAEQHVRHNHAYFYFWQGSYQTFFLAAKVPNFFFGSQNHFWQLARGNS
jgi:hypothetical protein